MLQAIGEALETLLGIGLDAGELGADQIALRALLVYAVTLLTVRAGSKRLLGKATVFDVILGIMIGSVMSRGINGSAGLVPTLAGGATLVALHWLFGVLSYHSHRFGNLVKGRPVLLVDEGQVLEDAMRACSLSARDLESALRLNGRLPNPSQVQRAYLERSGTISVVPRDRDVQVVEVSVLEGVQTVRVEMR